MVAEHSREELLELERGRWTMLQQLLGAISPSRADEPTLTPEGWTVRDLVWHLACWNDIVAAQLELMRAGAFDDRFDWDTEENNARFIATGHAVTLVQAKSALEASRADVIRAMQKLEDVPPRAVELFSEPAFQHVDDHVPELRRFLDLGQPG